MKLPIVVVVCVVIVANLCDGVVGGIPEIDRAVEKCSQEFNITPETSREWTNKKVEDINATEDLKCFSRCLISDSGVIKDKTVDVQLVRKLFAENYPKVEAIIAMCKDVYKGADTCDEAWDMMKCLYASEK